MQCAPPVALGAALALLSLSPSLGGAAVTPSPAAAAPAGALEASWVGGLPAILGQVLLDMPNAPGLFNGIASGPHAAGGLTWG